MIFWFNRLFGRPLPGATGTRYFGRRYHPNLCNSGQTGIFIKISPAMSLSHLIALLLTIFALTGGCQSKQPGEPTPQTQAPEATTAQEAEPDPEPDEPQPPAPPSPGVSRQIIRNATIRFRVAAYRPSEGRITALVRRYSGQIASSTESRAGDALSNDMVLRIPAGRLDPFLTDLLKESIYTQTKTLTAEDVTKQYVDTEARIRSKKATETRYLQLLSRARNVAEVMAVEEQLRQMREEIEVRQAELRDLKNDVAFSTVTLTFYEQSEAASNPEDPFYVRIGYNLRDGFGLVGDVLVGGFYLLPVALVLGIPVWLFLRWRTRRRARP